MLRSTNQSLKPRLSLLIALLLLLSGLTACSDSGGTPSIPASPGITKPSVAVSQTTPALTSSAGTAPPSLSPTNTPAAVGLKLESSTAATPGHLSVVTVMAFSPDGKLLATGSADQTVRLWDTGSFTNPVVAVLKGHYNAISSIAFSPDNKLIATGSLDQTVRMWEVAIGRPLALLQGHTGGVHALAFSPDGQLLASGSGDKTIKLWHLPDGKLTATLTGHGDKVNSLAFSPDGQLLASGSGDWQVKLWQVASHRELAALKGHSSWVQTVAFSPDGQTLASLSGDKTIKLWPVSTTSGGPPPVARLTINYRTVSPNSLTSRDFPLLFGPDGQTLTALTDYGLQSFALPGGQPLDSIPLAQPGAYVALSSTGQQFATSFYSPQSVTTQLWQVSGRPGSLSRKLWTTYGGPGHGQLTAFVDLKSVAYSPDGQFYATGSLENPVGTYNYKGMVRLW